MRRATPTPSGTLFGRLLAVAALACLAGPVSAAAWNAELSSQLAGDARGCWGWSNAGREYALVCRLTELRVVDCTNPSQAQLVASIPSLGSGFIEVRTYGNYAYAVNNHGPIQIIDLSNPANIHQVATYQSTKIQGAHTIEIDGHYAYLCLWGVGPRDFRILDLANPLSPVEVGFWRHPDMPPDTTGGGPAPAAGPAPRERLGPLDLGEEGSGEPGLQSHDCFVRGNRAYIANVLGGFAIVDLTNKASPQTLALVPYPNALSHSMWLSDDGSYLFTTDERPGGHLRVWSVANPANVTQVGEFETTPGHMIHNVYVRGSLLYVAYYADGLRVLDITTPTRPVEVAFYDTYDGPDGGYYAGAWGAYPYLASNRVFVSDLSGGLFVVAVDPTLRAGRVSGVVRDTLGQAIAGATIRFLEARRSVSSTVSGYFDLFMAPGPQTMVVERYGYKPDTSFVTVLKQGLVIRYVTLTALPFASLRIQVSRPGGGVVPGAAVRIDGLPAGRVLTDASGIADWGLVPKRDYRVEVGALGAGVASRVIDVPGPGDPPIVSIALPGTFYDDADWDQGWSLGDAGDDATSGVWVRDDPCVHWGWYGQMSQPDKDASGGTRAFAFHTGYGLPSADQEGDDVDGGKTTLRSPVFPLDGFADPVLVYSRWFSDDSGAFPSEDRMRAEISNDAGQTWALLEEVTTAPHSWVERSYRVRDVVAPTATMALRFWAEDRGGDSVVEAGIDRLSVHEATVDAGPLGAPALALEAMLPNPAPAGRATLSFRLGAGAARCRIDVVDVRGRVVSVIADGPRAAGPHTISLAAPGRRALAAGLYWLRVDADGRRAVRRFVVVS